MSADPLPLSQYARIVDDARCNDGDHLTHRVCPRSLRESIDQNGYELRAALAAPVEADAGPECECGHREADHYWTCGTCNHEPPYAGLSRPSGSIDAERLAEIAEGVRGSLQHTGDEYRRGFDRGVDMMVARLSDEAAG